METNNTNDLGTLRAALEQERYNAVSRQMDRLYAEWRQRNGPINFDPLGYEERIRIDTSTLQDWNVTPNNITLEDGSIATQELPSISGNTFTVSMNDPMVGSTVSGYDGYEVHTLAEEGMLINPSTTTVAQPVTSSYYNTRGDYDYSYPYRGRGIRAVYEEAGMFPTNFFRPSESPWRPLDHMGNIELRDLLDCVSTIGNGDFQLVYRDRLVEQDGKYILQFEYKLRDRAYVSRVDVTTNKAEINTYYNESVAYDNIGNDLTVDDILFMIDMELLKQQIEAARVGVEEHRIVQNNADITDTVPARTAFERAYRSQVIPPVINSGITNDYYREIYNSLTRSRNENQGNSQ